MQHLPTIAAQAWATAQAPFAIDPAQFGRDVAQVAFSCELAQEQGNEVTAVALALLSIPPGVLKELTPFFEIAARLSKTLQTNQAGEKS